MGIVTDNRSGVFKTYRSAIVSVQYFIAVRFIFHFYFPTPLRQQTCVFLPVRPWKILILLLIRVNVLLILLLYILTSRTVL